MISAINNMTTADPATNLPLNQIVSASKGDETLSGGSIDGVQIIVTASDAITAFTMAVSLVSASYIAGRQPPPFADDGYGNFLQDQSQTLFGHESALSAAFNLTGAEFALIMAALGFGSSTILNLANISAIFRFGWLSHALGLSVAEFLLLCQFSGLHPVPFNLFPFAPLDPASAPPAEPSVIRFIRLQQALANAGLQPVQALYLMWNQDISGMSAPSTADITSLAATLRADFAAVEAQFTLVNDPDGSIAKGLMALVYGSTATKFFFGLLNHMLTTSVTYSTPAGQPTLAQPIIDASKGYLSYSDLSKQLSYAGVLDSATQAAIDQAITANGNDANFHTQLAALATANRKLVAPFFAAYQELQPLYTAYAASADPPQTKRTALLASFLPSLKQKRKQEQAMASVTAAAGTDPSFAIALLQEPTILHADNQSTLAAVNDFTAIEAQGLSVQFYLSNNPGGTADITLNSAVTLSYASSVAGSQRTATIGGTTTKGDVLTISINGIAIPCQVAQNGFPVATLAGNVAAAINATAVPNITGVPLNKLVAASSAGPVITIKTITASSFTLGCSLSAGATETIFIEGALPARAGGGPIAGMWTGYLDVPQDGFYDITVTTDPGAAVTLSLGATAIVLASTPDQSGWSNQSPIRFVAGALAPIKLTAASIQNTLSVSWASLGIGLQVIPSRYLYPAIPVNHLRASYIRFLKAASLATALSLTANEIACLGTAPDFSVNTTDSKDKLAPGTDTYAPASMINISKGSMLVIDSGDAQETVTVASTAAAAFSAITAKPHDGIAAPFAILSQVFPNIGQGWLNFLGGSETDEPDAATAASLRDVLTALLDFARIKQALSPADERLLAVLQNPGLILPNGKPALLALTGWAQNSVNALLTQFFGNTQTVNLAVIENFRRVYDAYVIVQTCRITEAALLAATTNAPSAATASTLQSALRALYAEPDWLAVVRPINDTMRIRQRDALAAYILQMLGDQYAQTLVMAVTAADAPAGATSLSFATAPQIYGGMQVQGGTIVPSTVVEVVAGTTVTINPGVLAALPAGSTVTFASDSGPDIDTADKLFEFFLIDVETQPPVDTSRIRLALSSVQLFIERILRNLEPEVSPGDIDGALWPWMKRYRVWQANREVFLWPENWLYPELRDDQSPFFQQMMSALLQSDITDDAAANAYLDYLSNLEAVAKDARSLTAASASAA